MNNTDFVKKIFLLLDNYEQQKIINKSIQNGFTIDGFSKKPKDAPISFVLNSMNKKRGMKYQHEIIMEVMHEIAKDDNSSDLLKLVKRWIEDENTHQEIENEIQNRKIQRTNDTKDINHLSIPEASKDENIERLGELEEQIEKIKGRIKQQKQLIQNNKIVISDLEHCNNKLEKEKKLMQNRIDRLEKELICISDEKKKICEELQKREMEIEELKNNIEQLKLYKDNAPKILCIVKQNIAIEIPGYDIVTIHNWGEDVKELLLQEKYSKVWLVHNGFSYDIISDIKNYFEKELIKEYSNYKKIYDSFDGGFQNGSDRRKTDYWNIS